MMVVLAMNANMDVLLVVNYSKSSSMEMNVDDKILAFSSGKILHIYNATTLISIRNVTLNFSVTGISLI